MEENQISITFRDGFYYVSGALDESTDCSLLISATEHPIKIDFGTCQRVNSVGLRNFLNFLQEWTPRPLRYFECSSDFVEAVSVIPALTGADGMAIQSFRAPYSCDECHLSLELPLGRDEFSEEGNLTFPERNCPKCEIKLIPLMEAETVRTALFGFQASLETDEE